MGASLDLLGTWNCLCDFRGRSKGSFVLFLFRHSDSFLTLP